jgi:hypothetical protein
MAVFQGEAGLRVTSGNQLLFEIQMNHQTLKELKSVYAKSWFKNKEPIS